MKCIHMYIIPMRSDQLTDDQLSALAARVRPMMAYLARLEKRMRDQQFSDDDRLLVLVCRAREKLQDLHLELHYLSCDNVGRPPAPST